MLRRPGSSWAGDVRWSTQTVITTAVIPPDLKGLVTDQVDAGNGLKGTSDFCQLYFLWHLGIEPFWSRWVLLSCRKIPKTLLLEREIYTYSLHKSQVQQKVLKEIFWRDKIPGWDFFFPKCWVRGFSGSCCVFRGLGFQDTICDVSQMVSANMCQVPTTELSI